MLTLAAEVTKASYSVNYKKLSDEALLNLLRSEESGRSSAHAREAAFEEIYRRYWLMLYRLVWKKTGSREAAEELVQELFVSLWERRAVLELKGSLNNYLHTAVRYRVVNFIRRQILSSRHLAAIKNSMAPPAGNEVEADFRFHELDANIQASIEKLPAKSRAIFRLSRSNHFSNKQIAGRLNISEKTVEYHLTKSLKLLRVYLKDFVTLLTLFLLLK